jgi:thioredoxin-related protein
MIPLFLRFSLILLLSSLLNVVQADDSDAFFDQTWGNLEEELDNAREANKKGILLFFEMDECPFCSRMRHTIFTQEKVQAYFKQHFLIFPIDIEGETDMVDFLGEEMSATVFAQKKNRVRATPVMIFYDTNGQQLYRHTGPNRDAASFLLLGKYIVDDVYQTVKRFSQYRRSQAK